MATAGRAHAPREKPQILVTGAAGALARQVIRRLKSERGIVAVDFRREAKLGPGIPSYRVDFTKRSFEDVFRKHAIEGVIHLGRIGAEELGRESRYNANVLGSQKLFELAHKYGARQLLVLSTFFVYGASPYNPALLDETAPLKASGLSMDLIDSVELENLATLYLWKHPDLHVTVLRPCHIAGPAVRNSMSLLLSQLLAPVLLGFSPMMQFIHVEDMAEAIVLAFRSNRPGIYNVAPADWVPYQEALAECGCVRVPLPSLPPALPRQIASLLGWKMFPSFLVDFFRYPVIIDGRNFAGTFGWEPRHSLRDIFAYYRRRKAA
jgi:UDP-glucose 4-epimerase